MSSALVYVAIVLLVVISIVMAGTAVWLWRVNREDPAPLGPLEMMGERAWEEAGASERRVLLDESRPDPLRPVGRSAEEADLPPPRDPSDPIPVMPQFAGEVGLVSGEVGLVGGEEGHVTDEEGPVAAEMVQAEDPHSPPG